MDPVAAPPPQPNRRPPEPDLLRSARALETAFLAEMLKSAGTARPAESLGGGAGEEQFTSFLAEAQARALVAAGGLGLTEVIAESLRRQAEAAQ